jgi:hypothetical protein
MPHNQRHSDRSSKNGRTLFVIFGAAALGALTWLFLRPNQTPKRTQLKSQVAVDSSADSIEVVPNEGLLRTVTYPSELPVAGQRPQSLLPAASVVARIEPAQQAKRGELDLPWRHPGMCLEDPRPGFAMARARYLESFAPTEAWHTTLYVHPDVPEWAARVVQDNLEKTSTRVTSYLHHTAEPPRIYLYPSVEKLREHSCASAVAVAYYDGAIHLALESVTAQDTLTDGWPSVPRELQEMLERRRESLITKSLLHEYVHHVLVSNGVGKPIWFQEGAAMLVAHDGPHDFWTVWRKNPIDLRRMVGTFPQTSSLTDATIFCAQSYVMIEFLERLCWRRISYILDGLTDALMNGNASPETLFDWTISNCGSDLFSTTQLSLWNDYAERGNFATKTLSTIVNRAQY